MNVGWQLKPKISLGRALGKQAVQFIALALAVGALSFPTAILSAKETTTPKTFANWCLEKANLPPDTRRTVDVLLQQAGTTDCDRADQVLSSLTDLTPLDLTGYHITDLKPLSSLTTLTALGLSSNQIADLAPLSTLTNLTYLWLSNNQIADIKPLSNLTNLKLLSLDNNRIADIAPLANLVNLTDLEARNNQIASIKSLSSLTKLEELSIGGNSLADKTCPVNPASICQF